MHENTKPLISVVCPVFNEEPFIRGVIEFFISSLPVEKELFIIDGQSTDRTKEIALSYAAMHPNIFVLDNPARIVPPGLNRAIAKSRGDIIVRIDAHSEYSPDYFTETLRAFERSGAHIVGPPMRKRFKSTFQEAVACVMNSPFGTGNSEIHNVEYEGETDHVTYGAWKREIFEVTGLFDESLKRNQDEEFDYRAKKKGLKLFITPAIKMWYYPRATFASFFRQYYEYGLYKPIVLKKIQTIIKVRHLIPSIFVLYLLTLPLTTLFPWWAMPLLGYFCMAALFASRVPARLHVRALVFILFPVIHVAYGFGFLKGLTHPPA